MKIASKLNHNLTLLPVPNNGLRQCPECLIIPAGAIMEFDDNVWNAFSSVAALGAIAAGNLEVLVAAVSDLSVEEILAAIKEQGGVAADPSKSKAELQKIAQLLGVKLVAAAVQVEEVAEEVVDEESDETETDDTED